MVLYQLLSTILSPIIDLYLIYRKFKRKEDPLRFKERFGFSKIKRPDGLLIWLHSASVGESKSALTLAEAFLKKDPQVNILITSGTVTSAIEINKQLPQRAIHQYIPVDKFFAVRRFLKHWQPNLAIFVESELWPNLIIQTKKSACPLALVNGRISDQSFATWKILHQFGFNLIKNFTICFAQSQVDQQKFNDLGIKDVLYCGNIKAANPPLPVNFAELAKLQEQTKARKLWLAASTHKQEEEIIIQTHQRLKEHFPDLLTIIAPRHFNRLDEIVKLIPNNLKIAIRSQNQPIGSCEIYLADTMGELGTFYSLSKFSLIGGSMLNNIGGHNPLEAIQLGSVILSGCYVKNFQEIYNDLNISKACLMVKNGEELWFYLSRLMRDENFYQERLANIKKLQHSNNNIAVKIVEEIKRTSKSLITPANLF